MEEGQQQQESIQSCICTIPAARKEQGSGWAARDAVPGVPEKIMGLLCAGWGHVEAADVHNSRFFVTGALLVSVFSCFWSRGVGWGCWSPSVLPSTAQLTWALCRGRGNARVVSSWISELRQEFLHLSPPAGEGRKVQLWGWCPRTLAMPVLKAKGHIRPRNHFRGLGTSSISTARLRNPKIKMMRKLVELTSLEVLKREQSMKTRWICKDRIFF